MLKRMYIENFTVFAKADLEFGQLNVIHGENGTGKTHLLKLVHLGCRTAKGANPGNTSVVKFQEWLRGAFPYGDRQELTRWGTETAIVHALDEVDSGVTLTVGAYTVHANRYPIARPGNLPWAMESTYIPAQDALGRDKGWGPLAERFNLQEEQLGIGLRASMMLPPLKEVPPQLQVIYDSLVGEIGSKPTVRDDGQVYFQNSTGQRVYAYMSALGHNKLGLLALLIERFGDSPWALIWDEPEANLNPRLIKVVAKALVELAAAGVQVFVATHSLFLLRELELLSTSQAGKSFHWRHFGLYRGPDGVHVAQGDTAADAGSPAALDESLEQSERYLEWED